MNKAFLQDKQARMQAHYRQMQQKHKTQIPLNPLNFPPLASIAEMGRKI